MYRITNYINVLSGERKRERELLTGRQKQKIKVNKEKDTKNKKDRQPKMMIYLAHYKILK